MRAIPARGAAYVVAALLVLGTLAWSAGPAGAISDRWASWTPINGTSNDYRLEMRQQAPGFPAATVASDSRGNVQLPAGAGTFLGAATPPGAKYGSSRDRSYLVLRPRADNAASPSTTTYTFDDPTPDTGWGFVLGDVDADEVRVEALDGAGSPVPAAVVDGWFRGSFNYAGQGDRPTWDATASTLRGNPAATDTDGAAGWFEPDVRLSSLTLVFTRRAGFPVYQTWFVSRARPLGGMVADVSAVGSCDLRTATATLLSPTGEELGTAAPDVAGAFDLGELATQAGYAVRLTPPDGCAVVGSASAVLDNRGGDGSAASRAAFSVRRVVPQPISGSVTDTDGGAVTGAVVTLDRPDGSTVTTTTGADGTYLVDDNPVGTGYRLTLTVPDGYAPGPGGTTIAGLDVAASPLVDQDFVVRELPSVSGVVTGGGRGLGGVPVRLTPAGGGPALTTVTAGDGGYTFGGVGAGAHTITVVPPGGYDGADARTTTVSTADVVGQDFALTRPGTVSGAVTAAGSGVAGASVTVEGPAGTTTVRTEADGTYLVGGLPAGDQSVSVTPPAGFEVTGATTRRVTLTAAGEVRSGVDFALAAVVPPPDPGSVDGPTTGPGDGAEAFDPTASASSPPQTGAAAVASAGGHAGDLPDTGGPPLSLLVAGSGSVAAGLLLMTRSRRRPG